MSARLESRIEKLEEQHECRQVILVARSPSKEDCDAAIFEHMAEHPGERRDIIVVITGANMPACTDRRSSAYDNSPSWS